MWFAKFCEVLTENEKKKKKYVNMNRNLEIIDTYCL